jgi:hypothetical protein
MKTTTILLAILLSVSTIACTKVNLKPNISCPDPVIKPVSITDDKSILEALNLVTEAYIARTDQVECFKRALK